MPIENEFTARFFSKDSSDKYDNTLSSFTTEFDVEIDFEDREYEMGISQLFLNPCLDSEEMHAYSRDQVTMQPTSKTFNLREFIRYALEHSTHPGAFHPGYFSQYADSGIFFDPSILDHKFAQDTIKDKKDPISVIHDMTTLLYGGETMASFMLPHKRDNTTHIETFSKKEFPAYAGAPTTMKQILNTFVRWIVYTFRDTGVTGGNYGLAEHKLAIDKSLETANLTKTLSNAEIATLRRKHLESTNKMVVRYIRQFITIVQEEVEKMRNAKEFAVETPPKRFIFIYCDAIKPQQVGARKARVLFTLPTKGGEGRYFVHDFVQNIQYCRVEKSKLKTISFQLLTELGEEVNFTPSYLSNCIVTHFRRIKEV